MTTFKFIRPSNILDAGGSFARSTTATYFDIDGAMQTAAINVPRIGYDPVTHAHTGLILEAAATNLMLNSATVTNQDITVTAVPHTLTFYGTGTVTLTNAHSGSLVGSGAFPVRSSLTFTPSAGTLSIAVSGSCTLGQLEVGSVATSYIPTAGATVTRGADAATGSGLIYTDVPEADYPAWVGGTTYTADTDYVIRTTATTHKIYLCLVTHTTAATPEDNLTGATPKWLEVSPTNRWKIFDQKVGTTTTQADSMTYLLKPGRANSLALLGVDASSVEVSLVADGETVYTASFDLDSGNSVGDWYEYFYEPIYQTDSVVVTNLLDTTLFDLPQYADGVLCVRFLRDGGDVTCGVLVAGAYAELGQTLSDPTIGIIDYSRKSTDDFGNTTIVARTYSKRMTCSMLVASSSVDNVSRLLAQYRSTPVVWVAADNIFTSMIVYGFYKDWEVRIESPNHSTCNIQIEGLT